MGVTGAGKTTVGGNLAHRLGWPMIEGDDFHPAPNIAKLSAGQPLTDDDRQPWLAALAQEISKLVAVRESAVITCSALKAGYREQLRHATSGREIIFIYLRVSPSLAIDRVRHRSGHFVPPSLVHTQFAALEEPADALVIDAGMPPSKIVQEIVETLGLG